MDEIQRLEARVRFLGVQYLKAKHPEAIITEHLYSKLIEAVDKEIDRLKENKT